MAIPLNTLIELRTKLTEIISQAENIDQQAMGGAVLELLWKTNDFEQIKRDNPILARIDTAAHNVEAELLGIDVLKALLVDLDSSIKALNEIYKTNSQRSEAEIVAQVMNLIKQAQAIPIENLCVATGDAALESTNYPGTESEKIIESLALLMQSTNINRLEPLRESILSLNYYVNRPADWKILFDQAALI